MKHLYACLLVLVSTLCFGQPDTLWTRTFGGSGDEYASGIVALTNGNYVVAGTSNSFGAGDMDFYAVCFNGNGDTLWTRPYRRGNSDDWCAGVTQVSTGEIVLGGYGLSNSSLRQGVRQILYDTAGTFEGWSEVHLASADVIGYAICANTNARSAIAGCVSDSAGQGHLAAFGYHDNVANGFVVDMAYGIYSDGRAIAPTRDGGYIIAGSTRTHSSDHSDFLLVRLNSLGGIVWSHTYGGDSEDIAISVVQTPDGGFAFTGPTDSYGVNGDVVIVKTDSLGQQQWLHTYGGDGEEHGHCIIVTHDGGFFVVGHTTSWGVNGDVYVVKTDSAGILQWSRNWGGNGTDVGESAVELPDGGFLVAGQTDSYGAGSTDIWVLRIGPELAANQPVVTVPIQFSLAQNYPNPFNSSTRISFDLSAVGAVTLKIVDLLGRTEAVLLNGAQTAGRHDIMFDASALPSGVYFYRLETPQQSDTRKMILLK